MKNKKITSVLLALLILVTALCVPALAADDEELPPPIAPPSAADDLLIAPAPDAASAQCNLEINGEDVGIAVMVPLRAVAEKMGFLVVWHGEDSSVTLDAESAHAAVLVNKDLYQMTIGESMQTFSLGTAPIVINGTTYVPLSFFDVLLGSPETNPFSLSGSDTLPHRGQDGPDVGTLQKTE